MTESKITYLPIIPKSPENPACKKYLVFLLETIEYLELPHLSVHIDEQMYARILYSLWKHRSLFKHHPLKWKFSSAVCFSKNFV